MDPQELKNLRNWFRKNAAELPWRLSNLDAKRDPYAVWISETMLQQTQVATVMDYFTRWMKRFPDIDSLANSSEEEVFKYWQGLGYYSRARNILKTAKLVADSQKTPCKSSLRQPANLPSTRKELEALPGIGAYTAGAILSLAFHLQEAILDGNLVRIFSRYHLLDFLPTDKRPEGSPEISCSETYWNYARQVADSPKAYLHNEALMELGRRVCKVKNPDCENCPLKGGCAAHSQNRTGEFPPTKNKVQKDWHGTVLIVESLDQKILAVQGGQKFFNNQMALPHFESQRGAAAGLPYQAETYVNADQVESVIPVGKIKHNITVHKMECQVLHILLKVCAKEASAHLEACQWKYSWTKKTKVSETFANTFSLKSLQLL